MFLLLCPPVCHLAYPPVRWWWVRWSSYILPQLCCCSRWSGWWSLWLALLLLLLLPLGRAGCWEGSRGRTGRDLLSEGGGCCRSFWGCACVIGLAVYPGLSPLPSPLSPRPRDLRSVGCCGPEATTPSVSGSKRKTSEGRMKFKPRIQGFENGREMSILVTTEKKTFVHIKKHLRCRFYVTDLPLDIFVNACVFLCMCTSEGAVTLGIMV